ncbi:glycoside hydrolase family 1 protein [Patescibacteria group bacterium]|nr:glycoside hydrolase family 1 protein [Patescibacteria group bacterium]
MTEILKFPQNFLWATATSAYQVEGGIENSDWSKDFPAGRACDHYNLYEKDFDLIKKLNQNAYRFSIEWSRVEPREGKFNKKEIEHYKKVLFALRERNIKTMVTLHHFTNPLWLARIGGWTNSKIIFHFSRFAKRVFDEYRDLVDFWITINEPLVYTSLSYWEGRWPPFGLLPKGEPRPKGGPPKKKNPILFLKVVRNQIACHKKVYEVFHKSKRNIRMGIAKNNNYFQPFNPKSPLDIFNAIIYRYFWSYFFLNRIKNHLDFIGLNYYSRERVGISFPNKSRGEIKLSDIGWQIYPQGIYHVLKELKKYNLPIYITENGLADAEDRLRKDFIRDHLYWIHRAISEGIDVRGYFHWSLMDNFEWEKGFEPKFGLIEIDYRTLERKPRPSAFYYAQICKQNTLILNN